MERRVLHGNRVVEDHHHTVASVAFEGAAILEDDFANGRVVVAQQGHHIFGVCDFSEPGEAAQIAEERGDFPAVALKLPLGPGGDDKISHLRVKNAAYSHAFDFAYLVGDALFELLV